MKTTHLFEGHVYLISNHSVARNPMFNSDKMKKYFKERMEKYLLPISEIIAYNMNEHEFQILLRLKERKEFETFFLETHKETVISDIPESTHIFSRSMSNLQVSFVKHFNYAHHRSGALVASRFNRELIKSEKEMEFWIDRLNRGKTTHSYSGIWVNDVMKGGAPMTSRWIYEGGIKKEYRIDGYLNGIKSNLASSFVNLPPLSFLKNKYRKTTKRKPPTTPFLE